MNLDYMAEDLKDFLDEYPMLLWFGIGWDIALFAVLIVRAIK